MAVILFFKGENTDQYDYVMFSGGVLSLFLILFTLNYIGQNGVHIARKRC